MCLIKALEAIVNRNFKCSSTDVVANYSKMLFMFNFNLTSTGDLSTLFHISIDHDVLQSL